MHWTLRKKKQKTKTFETQWLGFTLCALENRESYVKLWNFFYSHFFIIICMFFSFIHSFSQSVIEFLSHRLIRANGYKCTLIYIRLRQEISIISAFKERSYIIYSHIS